MNKKDFKILIVDDDLELRGILADFCTMFGYKSELASDGVEALRLMRRQGTYDLAIVDFLMPEMNGAEFIKKAREVKDDFPIIIISACDDVEDAFIAAGANFFVLINFSGYSRDVWVPFPKEGIYIEQIDKNEPSPLPSINISFDGQWNKVTVPSYYGCIYARS